MKEKSWPELGLTDEVLNELYRRGRDYAARRISPEYRDDAVQDGMCEVLKMVANPLPNYPDDPEGRLKYLTKILCREALKRVTRRIPPDTNIPIE